MQFLIMNSSIKFLEGNKEACKIIIIGELVETEQVLKFECTLVPAGRVETSTGPSAFVI